MKRHSFALLFLFPFIAGAQLHSAAIEDFTLPAVGDAEPFVLSEHRGEYVALHFLLKTECPICLKLTRTYARKAALLPHVKQVFIKPDSESEIRGWMSSIPEDLKGRLTIYRDADAALAEKMGIPDGYEFHGETVHYPALVLIGPDGNEVFRYVGKNNGDRYEFEELQAKMAELRSESAVSEYNLPDSRLALEGYDPVAYFTQNRAVKGSEAIQETYRGVVYWFASEASRERFLDDPEKYLPAYGGWCATAMAEGKKVKIDPDNFKVTDGRLFLFYDGLFSNARKPWVKNEATLTKQADAEWQRIAGEEVQLER